jgi:hypothetical protein
VVVWKVQSCGNLSFFVAARGVVFQKQGKRWRTDNVSTVQEIDVGVKENGMEGKVGW